MRTKKKACEANDELKKDSVQQINDLIAEVNREMESENEADSERNNLDRIKHILKRIGFQQAAIDFKTSRTNKILIWLTFIAAIPAIEVVVKLIRYLLLQFGCN